MAAGQEAEVAGGHARGHDGCTHGRGTDFPGIAPRAVLHVGKVVAKGRYAGVSHPLRDGLERGVSHIRACSVPKDEEMCRFAGPHQQGRDVSLLRRGKEFYLFRFVSHFDVKEPQDTKTREETPRTLTASIVNRKNQIATPSSSSNFLFMCRPPV